MIITVTLNPAVDKTVEIDDCRLDAVNRIKSSRLDAGGKGINVSKTIASLGGTSRAIGILAGKTGAMIEECLTQTGIAHAFLQGSGETRMNLKIVDKLNGRNTDINETGPRVSAEMIAQLKEQCVNSLREKDILVLSGSVPPGVEKDVYREWIRAAKENGVRTVLDADGELLQAGLEAGPYLIKPNIHELERLAGERLEGEAATAEFARTLCSRYGIEVVVVSLGGEGALFVTAQEAYLTRGLRVAVQSTVGAGDAMVAGLALALEREADWNDLICLAVAAGTASVMTGGTEPGGRTLVEELAKQVKWEKLEEREKKRSNER
ncbi:1-phosphofructokinase [Azotosporobacter soli]|uniref:1-phosphofructokinase n=1 Tax=Azotosporobacter soli TaxID=3055040 RepID=UPI0031FF1711